MIGAIIQARMESTRLPKKVNRKILGRSLLDQVILRVKKANLVEKVVVAVPDTKENILLLPLAKKHQAEFYLGSMDNVLDRYIKAAEKFKIGTIIRITADCPLIDPGLINQNIEKYLSFKKKPDYFFIEGYPKGLGDIEIIQLEALKKISQLTSDPYYLEHVMPFFLEKPSLFDVKIEKAPVKFFRPDYRICVDKAADLVLVKKIFYYFKDRENFNYKDIIGYLDKNPKIASINKNVRQKS